MPRPNRHNEIEINFLMSGSLTYLFGGARVTIPANRFAVFWAAIPHQIVDYEGSSPYFVMTLPLGDFLQTAHEPRLVNRILHGELLVESVFDECNSLKFRQWETELSERDSAHEAAVRLEVQGRLLRFARRLRSKPTASSRAVNLSRADQIACYIARNYQKPLTSQSIAEAIGVHPNYAMNLFRQAFGTTMTSFITEHRISHAQRLLVTCEDSILSIAMDAGFQSLSRFNEAFKSVCGRSPREYRKEYLQANVK